MLKQHRDCLILKGSALMYDEVRKTNHYWSDF